MCQQRNPLPHSFSSKNYTCHTEREKERKKFHRNTKCSLVHTDCTLNESTKRAEIASAFPHRDSASQFQPVAAVSECGNLPLPFGGNDLLENPIAFPFSLYIRTPRPARSPNSERFSILDRSYDHFDSVRVWSMLYVIHNESWESSECIERPTLWQSQRSSGYRRPDILCKILYYLKRRPFSFRKNPLYFAMNFLQKC